MSVSTNPPPSVLLYGAHVHANGIRQHYLRYGGKRGARVGRDAVVIVPGITSPAPTWGFVAERFGQHFDTYILDVRGRGLSQASDTLDYSLNAQADDLNAFAATLKLDHYAVVGHSMGGRIAIRAAARQPTGLTRVVAVDPPVSGPGRRPYPAQLSWYIDAIRLARHGISLAQMREFCPTWTEAQLRLRAQWLHTCDERAITTSFHAFQSDDIHTDLPRIVVPLMLMRAERGDVIRDEEMAELRSLLPDLHEQRVAGAGHMIPWDNEAGFYQAFGDFLGAPLD